jgi:hypothetical protein
VSAQQNLVALSTPRKIFLGAALLLLIDSFLPWYSVSIGPFSETLTGWHQLGTVAWLLLIVLLVWEGTRLAGVAPVTGRRADLFSAVGALAVVVVGAIFVIQRISDGSLGFGFFLGVVLLAVLGYTAYGAFQASGGTDAVRQEVDSRRNPPAA